MTKKPEAPKPEPRRIPLSAGAALRIDALYRAVGQAQRELNATIQQIVLAAGHKDASSMWFFDVKGDDAELVEAPHDGR